MLFNYQFVSHAAEKLHQEITIFFSEIGYLNSSGTLDDINFSSDFKELVSDSPKLKKLLTEYLNEFKSLSLVEKQRIEDSFFINNKIESLCNKTEIPIGIETLTFEKIGTGRKRTNRIKELFDHLFEQSLKKQFNLKEHYNLFWNNLETKLCPFCGLEKLPDPEHYQADYDHILDKDNYPFSAVNLYNLAPACERCNEKYKFRKPYLFSESGNQRKAYFPYSDVGGIRIEIIGDRLPKNNSDTSINWKLKFYAKNRNEQEMVDTWVSVYEVDKRYLNEIKQEAIDTWFDSFIKVLQIKSPSGIATYPQIGKYFNGRIRELSELFNMAQMDLSDILKDYKEQFANGFKDRYFLKYAFFEFIYNAATESDYKMWA